MISETPILVYEESTTSSVPELESTGFVAEDDEPVEISEEEVVTSPLLVGVIAEELSGVIGAAGLLSSEQAENRPSAVTQEPTASHFLVFMSAFLI
jgi:hypothetical protein